MTHRSTSLVFTSVPKFLPPGAPLEFYELMADSNHLYEIDGMGRLIRKDRFQGTRWVSRDYTGSFTISTLPAHRDSIDMYIIYIVEGVVSYMQSITPRQPIPVDAAKWRWVICDLDVDFDALESVKTYAGCLKLIHDVEVKFGYTSGNASIDAMLGLALCRPEILPTKSARGSLELLADHQLRAISSWHMTRGL